MSICDPIEFDYARALDEHQARQIRPQCPAKEDGVRCVLDEGHDYPCCFDPYWQEDDVPEGEDDIDWEQRGLPGAEGAEGDEG